MNQLNESLLYSLKNIDEVVQESEMDVLNKMMSYYDKSMMYLEASQFSISKEEVIFEADTGTNLFHSIGTGLKKIADSFFKLIGTIFKRLIETLGRIGDIFRGMMGKDAKHPIKKTMSQILEENKGIVPRKDIDLSKIRKRTVTMPLDPSSTESIPKVNLYTSALVAQMNADGTMEFTMSHLAKDIIKHHLGGKEAVASQIPGFTQATPLSVMLIKNYENAWDHWKDAIAVLEAFFDGKIKPDEAEKKFKAQVGYLMALANSSDHVTKNLLSLKFNLDEMTKFQKELNEQMNHLHSEAQMIQRTEDDPNFKLSPDMITNINYLTASAFYIQTLLNSFHLSLNEMYVIPYEYTATINDFDLMGEFVNSMIEAGIPSKYIMLNAWLAGTREFTGNPGTYNEEKASKYKPAMGHCRGCFFPEGMDTSVYKIALNKRGISDIDNEYWVTNKIKGTPLDGKFAVIKKVNKYKTICEMEKIKTLEISDMTTYSAQTVEVVNEIKKYGNFRVNDLHTLNFGIRLAPEPSLPDSAKGDFIVSDYGALRFKDVEPNTEGTGDTHE